ncbi:uncharacterized protein HKW66_Vig0116010 [Vigna angularis]|uniref:DUF674 domain-containing protein n=1 Tax=Phaseolus angularis TaxID=3914 RepID=A0A8T0KZ28_PHAAN|nr:uncharacterized protein HKW66_Vig0116010 [Vigna angularis]
MAAVGTEERITLKLMVLKEENKVIFAEAGKDFVDVLFSFLTLPLGTIARVARKESKLQPSEVASLSSLYQSVENLDKECFPTDTCKEMLLCPRNSMEAYCRSSKINIDDTEPTEYFVCSNLICCRDEPPVLISTFRNKRCRCGSMLAKPISPETFDSFDGFVQTNSSFMITDDLKVVNGVSESCVASEFLHPLSDTSNNGKGYVKGPTTYMVTDDLVVTPSSSLSVVSLLRTMNIPRHDLQEKVVSIGKEEGVRILQASLSSRSALTLDSEEEEEEDLPKPAAKNGSVTASAKKGKPAAAASSSDLSEESSDEDDVPKTKAVPAAAKNITSSNKKTQPSGSSDSDSNSSSDEDDKKKISATTKLPASSDDDSSEDSDEDDDVKPSATAVSKPAVSKKKVDSFDSDDSSSDEDNKKAAKKVSNAKSVPVSKQPVKTSSTSDSDEEWMEVAWDLVASDHNEVCSI